MCIQTAPRTPACGGFPSARFSRRWHAQEIGHADQPSILVQNVYLGRSCSFLNDPRDRGVPDALDLKPNSYCLLEVLVAISCFQNSSLAGLLNTPPPCPQPPRLLLCLMLASAPLHRTWVLLPLCLDHLSPTCPRAVCTPSLPGLYSGVTFLVPFSLTSTLPQPF